MSGWERVEVAEMLCDSLDCAHDSLLRWVPHPPDPWWVRAYEWLYWHLLSVRLRRHVWHPRARWFAVIVKGGGQMRTAHGFHRKRDAWMYAAGAGVPTNGDIWLERLR